MSTLAHETYSLLGSVYGEYTRDAGPMPSGYAHVAITIGPCGDKHKANLVEFHPEGKWRLLEYRSPTGNVLSVPFDNEEALYEEAMLGIRSAALSTLQTYLAAPVVQVKIWVCEITSHPVYSTFMAFKVTAQKAIEIALQKAYDEGLLELT